MRSQFTNNNKTGSDDYFREKSSHQPCTQTQNKSKTKPNVYNRKICNFGLSVGRSQIAVYEKNLNSHIQAITLRRNVEGGMPPSITISDPRSKYIILRILRFVPHNDFGSDPPKSRVKQAPPQTL